MNPNLPYLDETEPFIDINIKNDIILKNFLYSARISRLRYDLNFKPIL